MHQPLESSWNYKELYFLQICHTQSPRIRWIRGHLWALPIPIWALGKTFQSPSFPFIEWDELHLHREAVRSTRANVGSTMCHA